MSLIESAQPNQQRMHLLDQLPKMEFGVQPNSITVLQVEADGKQLPLIHIATPTGVNAYVLDPSQARQLGEALQRIAQMCESGLVVPNGPVGP